MMEIRKKIYNIIEPRNHSTVISQAYDYLMLLSIVIGIIPLMFRNQIKLFWYFDIISCACYILDYILRWITCDYRSPKNKKWSSFVVYPFTTMAIIDMLSILPTINLLAPSFKLCRFSRFLKILRVVKFIRYYEPLEITLSVIKEQRKILTTVLTMAVFYIFITALIMFNGEEDINPETGEYLFNNFFDAFYWASCTLTTVGYGDLYPISTTGRVISIISSMVGIAIIALPSGIITAGYMEELRAKRERQNNKTDEIETSD